MLTELDVVDAVGFPINPPGQEQNVEAAIAPPDNVVYRRLEDALEDVTTPA